MSKQAFKRYLYTDQVCGWCADLGLLIGRVAFGGMMMTHGWDKLSNFAAYAAKFPDLTGLGSKGSLGLAVFAEFFCAILLALGLLTRLAAVPLIVTMSVAGFYVHRADPFAAKELALMYLTGFVILLLTGPGRYSADHVIGKIKR